MSMFLKKDEFTHNGASVPITELSALQRITYLEYLAAEEKALSAISDDVDDQTMSAGLVSMSIRAGARLIALSLWHNDPKGPSEEELHQLGCRPATDDPRHDCREYAGHHGAADDGAQVTDYDRQSPAEWRPD